ncbi:MAG: hypothetical protein HUJ63_04030 [Enterococcus sp.]|nr:hypothetical protein [Enterococcus sp.]
MYLNVGGMPAAVDKFRETQNLEDVIQIHEDIILQYKNEALDLASFHKRSNLGYKYV